MEDWRKNKLAFAVFMTPATFRLVVFFTIPPAAVRVYSFGERGPQGRIALPLPLRRVIA